MIYAIRQVEGSNMKIILAVAVCLAIATTAVCQSKSAPKGQQEKEQQLRTALQEMRDAIDHYHGMFIRGKIMAAVDSNGYPPDLQTLVGGVEAQGKTIHLLRKIPIDPMTGATEWGLRKRGGVFDVYSESQGKALDGTDYKDW
jgi:general secretion pathway protein G